MFSCFLPKSLVRVRPVSRKCVGHSDQSASCLCALYLSQCSILVCVCFVLVCIRCHCLYDRNVYVCFAFVCVLDSMYLFAPCVLLGILFSISVSSSSSNALLLVCYLCVFFCNPLLFRMCRPTSHFFSWPQRYDEPLLIEQKLPVSMPAYAQDVKLSTLSFLKKYLTLSCMFVINSCLHHHYPLHHHPHHPHPHPHHPHDCQCSAHQSWSGSPPLGSP